METDPRIAFIEMLVERVSALEARLEATQRERNDEAVYNSSVRVVDGVKFQLLSPRGETKCFWAPNEWKVLQLSGFFRILGFKDWDWDECLRVVPHWKPVVDRLRQPGCEPNRVEMKDLASAERELVDESGQSVLTQLNHAYISAKFPEVVAVSTNLLFLRRTERLKTVGDVFPLFMEMTVNPDTDLQMLCVEDGGSYPVEMASFASKRSDPARRELVRSWGEHKAWMILYEYREDMTEKDRRLIREVCGSLSDEDRHGAAAELFCF